MCYYGDFVQTLAPLLSVLPLHQTPPTLPEQEVPTALLLTSCCLVTMASTDQSLLDLTDKETREKLSHWDRRPGAMAPLSEKQMDSVLEIRAAAETISLPTEVR